MRRCFRSCGEKSGVPVAVHALWIVVRSAVDLTPGKTPRGYYAVGSGRPALISV
jgi:hypothetical protein